MDEDLFNETIEYLEDCFDILSEEEPFSTDYNISQEDLDILEKSLDIGFEGC